MFSRADFVLWRVSTALALYGEVLPQRATVCHRQHLHTTAYPKRGHTTIYGVARQAQFQPVPLYIKAARITCFLRVVRGVYIRTATQ
jgi:hypothetical protein